MPSWITFDDDTSSALRSRLPEQPVHEFSAQSALEHALNDGDTTVAVLPCRGLGQAALAVFRWTHVPTPVTVPAEQTRAGGILGLTDESVLEEEAQEKKSWWRKFWDE